MNDDKIRSELERRAGAAGSRPDWVRRDLLPAVRHEIDARPQPVMTSSWSPRLGVAAVVAALLIMVIAVPRLAPQPPAATPSPTASPPPGPETVLSTSEFADGVASGQLIGRVVLVQGTISVPSAPAPADYPCNPPDGFCALGALQGTEPPLFVYTTYTPTTDSPGSGTWAGDDGGRDYHFPTVPIEGVFALRAMSGNDAAFIGLIKNNAASSIWSVSEAQALDISTITPDDVILVRGWLSTKYPRGTVFDCASPPFPDLVGLPSRYCVNTGFLSGPNNAGQLQVQEDALQFAPAPAEQEAVYAVSPRLYGGGCSGAPPCWLWDVIARLNGPPSSPIYTAPVTIDCTRRIGLPIAIIDEAGVVADCRTLDGVSQFDPPAVMNPDGNLSRMQVFASVDRCVSGVDARLTAGPGGYDLVITERPTVLGCSGPAIGVGFDIGLRTDIAASTVNATLASPQPQPSPSPPDQVGVIECVKLPESEGLSHLGPATVYDSSGLVDSCEMVNPTGDEWISNPAGDLKVLMVRWPGTPCDARSDVLLAKADAVYTVAVRKYTRNCDASLVWHAVRISLRSEVSVDLVDFQGAFEVTPPSPSPTPTAIRCGEPGIEVSILNPGDLVASCRQVSPLRGPAGDPAPGVEVVTDSNDPTHVRIRWVATVCTKVAWLTLTGSADHAFFEISPAASCTLTAARVLAVELVLSRPVEVTAGWVIPV